MKNESKKQSVTKKGLMDTLHVFSENNKVYLKKNNPNFSTKEILYGKRDWHPINFYWKSMRDLQSS